MIALSVKQPWAWLLIRPDLKKDSERQEAIAECLIKNIENRTWWTNYTGPLIIHVSKTMTPTEYEDCGAFLFDRGLDIELPEREEFQFGGILGKVHMAGATHSSTSKWFTGPVGFVFKDPAILPFKPLSGKQGFFEV